MLLLIAGIDGFRCSWSCSSFHFARSNHFTEVGVCPPVAVLSFATYVYVYKNVNPPAMWNTWVRSLGWEDPWRMEGLPTLVFWPTEIPWTQGATVSCTGLVGYIPWGCKESDMTERLSLLSIFFNLVHFMCFLKVLDWHCTICPFVAFQSVMLVTYQCWYAYI